MAKKNEILLSIALEGDGDVKKKLEGVGESGKKSLEDFDRKVESTRNGLGRFAEPVDKLHEALKPFLEGAGLGGAESLLAGGGLLAKFLPGAGIAATVAGLATIGIALAKTREESQKTSNRLQAFGAGKGGLEDLEKQASKLGTTAENIRPTMERFYANRQKDIAQQNQRGGISHPPGYESGEAEEKASEVTVLGGRGGFISPPSKKTLDSAHDALFSAGRLDSTSGADIEKAISQYLLSVQTKGSAASDDLDVLHSVLPHAADLVAKSQSKFQGRQFNNAPEFNAFADRPGAQPIPSSQIFRGLADEAPAAAKAAAAARGTTEAFEGLTAALVRTKEAAAKAAGDPLNKGLTKTIDAGSGVVGGLTDLIEDSGKKIVDSAVAGGARGADIGGKITGLVPVPGSQYVGKAAGGLLGGDLGMTAGTLKELSRLLPTAATNPGALQEKERVRPERPLDSKVSPLTDILAPLQQRELEQQRSRDRLQPASQTASPLPRERPADASMQQPDAQQPRRHRPEDDTPLWRPLHRPTGRTNAEFEYISPPPPRPEDKFEYIPPPSQQQQDRPPPQPREQYAPNQPRKLGQADDQQQPQQVASLSSTLEQVLQSIINSVTKQEPVKQDGFPTGGVRGEQDDGQAASKVAELGGATEEAVAGLKELASVAPSAAAADRGAAPATVEVAGGGFVRRFGDGGKVNGAGSSTSDSVRAMLSDGEYVMKTDAVKRIGVDALDAANEGRAHFDDGGPVDYSQIGGPIDYSKLPGTDPAYGVLDAAVSSIFSDIHRSGLSKTYSDLHRQTGLTNAYGATHLSPGAHQITATPDGGAIIDGVKYDAGAPILRDPFVQGEIAKSKAGAKEDKGSKREPYHSPFIGDFGRTAGDTEGGSNTYASGGPISGPGTSTSDDIPAYLSHGEFVVNARETARNRPVLAAINEGKFPSHIAKMFANGGRIELPRFADGGMTGVSSPDRAPSAGDISDPGGGAMGHYSVDLRTNHGDFSVMAPEHVMRQMSRASVASTSVQAGPRPSWYGK